MRTLLAFTLLTLLMLNACKGPKGDPGPQGATGSTGSAGTTGTTGSKGNPGANGNANAVYADWKTPSWDGPVVGIGITGGSISLRMASTANALLTKEAINTAVIYTYIKYNELIPTTTNPAVYTLTERITSDRQTYSFYKIPGRTTNTYTDYAYVLAEYDDYGENYFAPRITLFTANFDTQGNRIIIPEFINKTEVFYKNLVNTLPQYRHIIVYGNVKGGRLATINWNDYSEVKEVLQLKD